jgi:hypothetical protein
MAAGAKVQSRPPLGQSGRVTGQQYGVHKELARENSPVNTKEPQTASSLLSAE